MSHWSAVALVVLGASSSFALTQPRAAGEVHFEPYSFRTYDGKSHTAERGHLWVMQDRSDSAKGLIELGVCSFAEQRREVAATTRVFARRTRDSWHCAGSGSRVL